MFLLTGCPEKREVSLHYHVCLYLDLIRWLQAAFPSTELETCSHKRLRLCFTVCESPKAEEHRGKTFKLRTLILTFRAQRTSNQDAIDAVWCLGVPHCALFNRIWSQSGMEFGKFPIFFLTLVIVFIYPKLFMLSMFGQEGFACGMQSLKGTMGNQMPQDVSKQLKFPPWDQNGWF